ncbi:hypothetical protein CVT25_010000 [Psilocybe cyanescens]|uniref:Uncharacterized protein n=1 Tax=Psilocybe cyanescens TaxID=93625 RepID=A0A409XGR8_PSICY|nr:hypothetical protein CVT25_010000 [Psilocybe cyanescens]
MSHSSVMSGFPTSFSLNNTLEDFYDAPLRRAIVWCTSSKYDEWRISFETINDVRQLTYIYVKLVDSLSIASKNNVFVRTQVDPGVRRSTRVLFIPRNEPHTTGAGAVELAEAQVTPGTTLRDVMVIMAEHIPYYELTEKTHGVSAWVYSHVENFLFRGILIDTPGTGVINTIQNKIIQYNNMPGYIHSPESTWPLTQGTVHQGPP